MVREGSDHELGGEMWLVHCPISIKKNPSIKYDKTVEEPLWGGESDKELVGMVTEDSDHELGGKVWLAVNTKTADCHLPAVGGTRCCCICCPPRNTTTRAKLASRHRHRYTVTYRLTRDALAMASPQQCTINLIIGEARVLLCVTWFTSSYSVARSNHQTHQM